MHRPLRLSALWRDPRFVDLPDRTRIVLLGILQLTNDRGVCRASDEEIAHVVYPGVKRRDGARPESVDSIIHRSVWLLLKHGHLRASQQPDGTRRLRVVRWHQLFSASLSTSRKQRVTHG